MPNFAIMRSKKLKSLGSVASSLKHTYRERETPNADPEKLRDNDFQNQNTNAVMGALRDRLPEKYRKDAVVAVEYLCTASPSWWETASPAQQADFFERSKNWLQDKYGADNVLATVIHRDETTPHMSAFVVPKTADGRLSAKEFIGNRTQMSKDQTSFADKMADLGLERGIEGSKARHQTIQKHYANLNKPIQPLILDSDEVTYRVISQSMFSKTEETPEEVAERLNKRIQDATEPLLARARELEAIKASAKAQLEAATTLRQRLERFYKQVIEGLKPDQQQALVKTVGDMRAENAKTAEKDRIEAERQRRVDSLPNLVKTRAGAVLVFAQNALEAIKAKAGNWRSVDWAGLEKTTAHEAIHKHRQPPAEVAEAVLRHSPNHADKSEAQIKAVVDNVRLKSAPEAGLRRDDENDLSR